MQENSSFLGALRGIPERVQASDRNAARRDIEALINEGTTDFASLARLALGAHPSVLRAKACWVLGWLDEAKGSPVLLAVIARSRRQEVVWEAAKALEGLRRLEVVKPLVRIAEDARPLNRKAAVWVLGGLRARRAVPALVAIFRDWRNPTDLRAHAAEALGYIRDPKAGDTLLAGLYARSQELRYWSIFALGQMRFRRALPHLNEVLQSPDVKLAGNRSLREEAREAIEQISEG